MRKISSYLEVDGFPDQGSSSMDSQPSENSLNHLKTSELDKAVSPQAC